MQFQDLDIGDMFNTKPARFVKTSDTEAIVVMSGVKEIGDKQTFTSEFEVIPLYSREREVEILRAIERWTNSQEVKLRAGEMTAQEERTAMAVLKAFAREIKSVLGI